MFIRVNNKTLTEAVLPALCAVTPRATLSSLSSLRLEANKEENTLTITGYDIQKGLTTTISAEVLDEGSMLMDAHRLAMICRSLPDGEVSLSSDENYLTTISSLNSKFEVSGVSSHNYPTLPSLSGERYFEMSQGLLKKMLQQVLFSYSLTDTKPVLTGIYFSIDPGLLEIVSCDGYRISLTRRLVTEDARDADGKPIPPVMTCNFSDSFLVPGKNVAELYKLLEDTEAPIRVELARKHVIFCFEDKTFFSRLLEGDYINYQSSMPKEYKTRITVDLARMAGATERAGLLIDEKIKSALHFSVLEDGMLLRCSTGQGRTEELVDATVEGDTITLGFNHRFLMDAFRGAAMAGQTKIELRLNGPLNGLLIEAVGDDRDEKQFFYLVLPVKLNG